MQVAAKQPPKNVKVLAIWRLLSLCFIVRHIHDGRCRAMWVTKKQKTEFPINKKHLPFLTGGIYDLYLLNQMIIWQA